MALESATFLIRNQYDVKIPSNFTGRAMLEYDVRVPWFPESKAEEVGALLQVAYTPPPYATCRSAYQRP